MSSVATSRFAWPGRAVRSTSAWPPNKVAAGCTICPPIFSSGASCRRKTTCCATAFCPPRRTDGTTGAFGLGDVLDAGVAGTVAERAIVATILAAAIRPGRAESARRRSLARPVDRYARLAAGLLANRARSGASVLLGLGHAYAADLRNAVDRRPAGSAGVLSRRRRRVTALGEPMLWGDREPSRRRADRPRRARRKSRTWPRPPAPTGPLPRR